MIKVFEILTIIFLISSFIFSQETAHNEFGVTYRYQLNNTPFPHKDRIKGYTYDGQKFNVDDHYSDQSVLIFIPDYFSISDSIDMVFYFHGWRNNIDSSLTKFKFIEQFYNSTKNAILVLPEGAKNAPDSFGGKLEEENIFKGLVQEILSQLEIIYKKQLLPGNISLAGHSGAYRVMAYIIMNGGYTERIDAVYIFDGLYADIEKFTYWIENYKGRFINIYTPNGGTKLKSENLIEYFKSSNISYKLIETDYFSADDISDTRIVFIKSELGHSEVIQTKNQFQKFLESSL